MSHVILEAREVSFGYSSSLVVQDVSLQVQAGQMLALIGPNGAGKTTLLKILAGLLKAKHGEVIAPIPRAKRVAYLSQSEALPLEFTVQEIVAMGRLPHQGLLGANSLEDSKQVFLAMQRTDITQFANRRIHNLSGGEKQRVTLARALAQNPEVLLLDEPTNHLDLAHQAELLEVLALEISRGLSVIMVVHDLILASRANSIALLHQGKLERIGTPNQVLEIELLERVYQTKLERLTTADGRTIVITR